MFLIYARKQIEQLLDALPRDQTADCNQENVSVIKTKILSSYVGSKDKKINT